MTKACGFCFDSTYKSLPSQLFTENKPDYAPSPKALLINNNLALSLGLDLSTLTLQEQSDIFSGNRLPKGASPFSQAYAGHQFGHFNILGDGRAHLWGEHVLPSKSRVDIQFKGSGRTAYSRGGDGKASLEPMLREYIISEAMHCLGVPTTRSLAVVTTGELIAREVMLPGAVLTRVASSYIRVGTFEFAAYTQDNSITKKLMDYTIRRHYPELAESDNLALSLIYAVCEKQAELIVQWMRVGFIHGVMNTDNMTLSGETLDYGPCAFIDSYDPQQVFSSIDHNGRYAYGNQHKIAQWNLARLAETLLPFIDSDPAKALKLAETAINQFAKIYQDKWLAMMREKLGLFEAHEQDEELIFELLSWMKKNYADYTNTFWQLGKGEKMSGGIYEQPCFEQWYLKWQSRVRINSASLQESLDLMNKRNPAVIPRNHLVERALKLAQSDNLSYFKELLEVLRNPYQDSPSIKTYQEAPQPHERVYQTFCGT